jgi:trehalose 6-phosphate synthase
MNLVAKEFVCARDDERGVLVLSRFTGAAKQLTGALQVNPHAVEASVDVLRRALAMPVPEQVQRMRQMRASVATFSASWWAQQLVRDCAHVFSTRTSNLSSTAVSAWPGRDFQLGRELAESPPSTRWRMSTR